VHFNDTLESPELTGPRIQHAEKDPVRSTPPEEAKCFRTELLITNGASQMFGARHPDWRAIMRRTQERSELLIQIQQKKDRKASDDVLAWNCRNGSLEVLSDPYWSV